MEGNFMSERRLLSTTTKKIKKVRDKRLQDYQSWFINELKLLERLININTNTKILDVGCGTGWFTLLTRKKGLNCIGYDRNWQLIEYAKEWSRREDIDAKFVEGDITKINFVDEAFDLCFCMSALEHVKDWKSALKELHRVLRPGGLLYVNTTNGFHPISSEVAFPLFPYLPKKLQYKITVMRDGEDAVLSGMAWNHFSPIKLKKFLKEEIGFSNVIDKIDIAKVNDLKGYKKIIAPFLNSIQKHHILRYPLYFLMGSTHIYAYK
jgi:ubiquinone/menaquinone biosynthesis C-methylase UbiE